MGILTLPTLFCRNSSTGEIWTTYLAFLIQQIQNSHFGLDEVNAGLIVVEINQGPRNLFPHVFFLLQLKDVLCEIIISVRLQY